MNKEKFQYYVMKCDTCLTVFDDELEAEQYARKMNTKVVVKKIV